MIRKLPFIGIIDDDKIYQFTLMRIINDNKQAEKIITFSDGEKAIHYLTDNKSTNENIPDIIFLDVNMPIMDGWQFIDEYASIKTEIKKKIVIFMLSSSVNPIDIERASKINEISDYIIKPMKLEEVKMFFDNF
ncbi:response regulator [Patiriisocius sp. Uisw_017]|jgi:CheY-like chemotaxis protein|uniref:response regulator n=1 Tax=Patiriisocius sp. Uisw_017 TaxID=3230968 RepID=UPI0039E7634B